MSIYVGCWVWTKIGVIFIFIQSSKTNFTHQARGHWAFTSRRILGFRPLIKQSCKASGGSNWARFAKVVNSA